MGLTEREEEDDDEEEEEEEDAERTTVMEGALTIDVDSFYEKGWLSCKTYHPNQVFDLAIGLGTGRILQHYLA